MWKAMRQFLAKWEYTRDIFADVVFVAPAVRGQSYHASLTWRLKRRPDGVFMFSLKVIPDHTSDGEGIAGNYIDFSLEHMREMQHSLQLCLAEHERLRDR